MVTLSWARQGPAARHSNTSRMAIIRKTWIRTERLQRKFRFGGPGTRASYIFFWSERNELAEPQLGGPGQLLFDLLQSFGEQFALAEVLGQSDGALDFLARLGEPAKLQQQVAANAGEEVVGG